MTKKHNESYINKDREYYVKRVDNAENLRLTSGILAGIFGGVSLLSFGAGVATGVMSQNELKELTQSIYASSEYQNWLHERAYDLLMDCTAGKITFEEYNEAIDDLMTDNGVLEYAQTLSDEEIVNTIQKSKDSDELADRYIGNGFAMMFSLSMASAGVSTGADFAKKKRKIELETFDAEQEKV